MKIIEHTADFVMDAVEFVGGVIISGVRLAMTIAVAFIILVAAFMFLRLLVNWDTTIFPLFPSAGPTLLHMEAETATVAEMES